MDVTVIDYSSYAREARTRTFGPMTSRGRVHKKYVQISLLLLWIIKRIVEQHSIQVYSLEGISIGSTKLRLREFNLILLW
jgi:ABC-type arginine/histidine transport system permease subunit